MESIFILISQMKKLRLREVNIIYHTVNKKMIQNWNNHFYEATAHGLIYYAI